MRSRRARGKRRGAGGQKSRHDAALRSTTATAADGAEPATHGSQRGWTLRPNTFAGGAAHDAGADHMAVLGERAEQRAIADDVDETRHAARESLDLRAVRRSVKTSRVAPATRSRWRTYAAASSPDNGSR